MGANVEEQLKTNREEDDDEICSRMRSDGRFNNLIFLHGERERGFLIVAD